MGYLHLPTMDRMYLLGPSRILTLFSLLQFLTNWKALSSWTSTNLVKMVVKQSLGAVALT